MSNKITKMDKVRELLKKNPGKFNYASAGNGSSHHLAGEQFKMLTKTFITHIPYRGAGPALSDLIAGQVDMMFDAIPTMVEQVKGSKVKAMATSGKSRSTIMPDTPTLDEGVVSGYEATIWLGVMAPKGTPGDIVELLAQSLTRIMTLPDVQARFKADALDPAPIGAAHMDKFIRQDLEGWKKVVQQQGIKLNSI